MSSGEQQTSTATTGQPHLQQQDLSKLNIAKLTPLSPEVISRQATINIGTIGHVAHGKSTVVKAISGVQTVRFKNELERNITIKLECLSENLINVLTTDPKEMEAYVKKIHERYKSPYDHSSVLPENSEVVNDENGSSSDYCNAIPVSNPENGGNNNIRHSRSVSRKRKLSFEVCKTQSTQESPTKAAESQRMKQAKIMDFFHMSPPESSAQATSNQGIRRRKTCSELRSISSANNVNGRAKRSSYPMVNIKHEVLENKPVLENPTDRTFSFASTSSSSEVGVNSLPNSFLDVKYPTTVPPVDAVSSLTNDLETLPSTERMAKLPDVLEGELEVPSVKQRSKSVMRKSANNGGSNSKQRKRSTAPKEYTVESINDIQLIGNAPYFLIKWLGYSEAQNTWEPLDNVKSCMILDNFLTNQLTLLQDWVETIQKKIKTSPEYMNEVIMHDTATKTNSEILHDYKQYDWNVLRADLIIMAKLWMNRSRNKCILERIVQNMCREVSYVKRRDQLEQLKQFEKQINMNEPTLQIVVENEQDMDAPPNNFTYLRTNVPGEGISIPNDPPVGCECNPCQSRSECCGKLSEGRFAYSAKKRLLLQPGAPIFECNKKCKCGPDCLNRVVQNGGKCKLTLFKTKGRGWGVRTNAVIYEGQYISEYCGEVISYDEAEKRGREYDAVGRTYLFDLDFNGSDNPFTLDAAHYGNVTRFFNHSCDPNCGIWSVWIDCLDPYLPRLAFFALRRIEAGEELTFNYHAQLTTNNVSMNESENVDSVNINGTTEIAMDTNDDSGNVDRAQPSSIRNTKGLTECLCGSANCRKFVF